jgi:hypothetical protein
MIWPPIIFGGLIAGVAQLVEQLFRKQQVGGSSPLPGYQPVRAKDGGTSPLPGLLFFESIEGGNSDG